MGKQMHMLLIIAIGLAMITTEAAWMDQWTFIQLDNTRECDVDRWFGLAFGDVNGDGLQDQISGRWVYLNPGGNMEKRWQRIQTGNHYDSYLLFEKGDIDNDDYPDIFAARSNYQFWVEATKEDGSAWRVKEIGRLPYSDHGGAFSQGVIKADIFKGGNVEIIATNKNKMYAFVVPDNPDGHSGHWETILISTKANSEDIEACDLDHDGDLDLIHTDVRDNSTHPMWYENPGKKAGNWNTHEIGRTEQWADRFEIADFDNDGDIDVMIAEGQYQKACKLWWFANPGGKPTGTWKRHFISNQGTQLHSLSVADLDFDGDVDIVLGELYNQNRLFIIENKGGGTFGNPVTIDKGKQSHNSARLWDMDQDGDLDIISVEYKAGSNELFLWRNDNNARTQNTVQVYSGVSKPVLLPPIEMYRSGATYRVYSQPPSVGVQVNEHGIQGSRPATSVPSIQNQLLNWDNASATSTSWTVSGRVMRSLPISRRHTANIVVRITK